MGNRPFISVVRYLLILFCSVSLLSCAYNEATDTKQFNIVSEEEELKIGREADKVIREQYGVYDDLKWQAYVDKIGQRLVANSGRPDIPYHFLVVDSPVINAFALPGGYIYVTRGILANMNSEAELAFVLGHEISHVAARHGAQRLSQQRGLMIASVIASMIFEEGVNKYSDWVDIGVGLAVRGYGRENEFEADMLGCHYAFDSNYHPDSFTHFFKTLKRQEKHEPDWFKGLLASHPPTGERIERVKLKVAEIIEEKKPNLKSFDVVQQGFVRRLEDLVLGENPVLGSMKKTLYENVPHAFSIEVPARWSIGSPEDLGTLLIFSDKKKRFKGRLHVEYRKRDVPLKEFASEYDNKEHRVVRQNLSYFSLPAVRTTHRYPKTGKDFVVSTYFVHGRHTYRFVFESKFKDKGDLLAVLDKFLKTATFMSPEQVKKKGSARLRLHIVRTNDTFAKIAKKYYPNNKDAIDRFKAFNGMHNGSITLRPGNVIKIPEISSSKKD